MTRRWCFVVGALLVLTTACGGGIATLINRPGGDGDGPLTPRDPVVHSLVAADLRQSGVVELFALDEGGGPPVLLSPEPDPGGAAADVTLGRFAVAPDGARVAFLLARKQPAVEELFVADLRFETAPIKLHPDLGDGQRVVDFDWSPDGAQLAFVADLQTAGVPQLFTTTADGSEPRLALPAEAGPVANARTIAPQATRAAFLWSLDSTHLACATADPALGAYALWVVDAAATTPRRLAPALGQGAGLPMERVFEQAWLPFAWSPDATAAAHLAYLVERAVVPGAGGDPPGHELRIAALDGSDDRRLSHRLPPSEPPPDVLRFALAPDGRHVAYAATRRDPEQVELWCNATSSAAPDFEARRLSRDGTSGAHALLYRDRDSFAWSPDSQRIAFRGEFDTLGIVELYVAVPTQSPPTIDRVNTRLRLPGQRVATFAWAPDSARIAYVANEIALATFELFCARADASSLFVVSRADATGDADVLVAPDASAPWFASDDAAIHWSPDSTRLAWLADGEVDGRFEAWSALPDGGDRFRLNGSLPSDDSDVCRVTWLDAATLLYVADERSVGRFDLWSARADGPLGVALTGAAERGATTCPRFALR